MDGVRIPKKQRLEQTSKVKPFHERGSIEAEERKLGEPPPNPSTPQAAFLAVKKGGVEQNTPSHISQSGQRHLTDSHHALAEQQGKTRKKNALVGVLSLNTFLFSFRSRFIGQFFISPLLALRPWQFFFQRAQQAMLFVQQSLRLFMVNLDHTAESILSRNTLERKFSVESGAGREEL